MCHVQQLCLKRKKIILSIFFFFWFLLITLLVSSPECLCLYNKTSFSSSSSSSSFFSRKVLCYSKLCSWLDRVKLFSHIFYHSLCVLSVLKMLSYLQSIPPDFHRHTHHDVLYPHSFAYAVPSVRVSLSVS